MGFIKALAACFISALVMATVSEAMEWRGIIPLRSTRADVERLLGPPMKPGINTYDIEKERVTVFYSQGQCLKDTPGWRVPRDTVVDIYVAPKQTLPVSALNQIDDLKLDSPNFRKLSDPHNEGSFYYTNQEEGILVETSESYRGQFVTNVTYRPTAADNHLRCPTSATPPDKEIFDPHLPPPPTAEPSPSPSKRRGTKRTSSRTGRRSPRGKTTRCSGNTQTR